MDPEFIVVGHINKAHGTKGEVFVWPLTDRPEALFVERGRLTLADENGKAIRIPETVLQIERVRPFHRGYLVKFVGVENRTRADWLLDQYLVTRFETGERPPDEFYYHELLELEVVTTDGKSIGRVREVYELSPDHMLDVEGLQGSILVPLNSRIITSVDREAQRITIDPPEGFLELQE